MAKLGVAHLVLIDADKSRARAAALELEAAVAPLQIEVADAVPPETTGVVLLLLWGRFYYFGTLFLFLGSFVLCCGPFF